MNSNIKWLLFISFLFCTSTIFAQNFFFVDAAESVMKMSNQKRVIVPTEYRTLKMDTGAFAQFLQLLPLEKDLMSQSIAPIFSIPMPDGQLSRFRVWESPTIASSPRNSFISIRTFTGQGIDDPTATIKFDWTVFGFHAMVLSVNGSYFIDPYDQVTTTHYISYYKKNFIKSEPFFEYPPIRYKTNKVSSRITPDNIQAGVCVGSQLKTYRLAVACTHQYAAAATGLATPTKLQTLAKIVISVNRVNGVYEKELSVRLVLVPNDTLVIFPIAAGDPFTGNNSANTLINESQTQIDAKIGSANYDIGHTFSTGGGGLAGLGVVCQAGQKANGITGSSSPVGDPYDIDYVAHEMGHQFGGDHTFNSTDGACGGNGSNAANCEPGSGSTIMAYAGICNPSNLQTNSDAYFTGVSFDEITDYINFGTGNSCPVNTSTSNVAPVVNAGQDYYIPLSTPFLLTGSATDANNDVLTYCWEQVDVGGPFGTWNAPSGNAPIFRSFNPVTTPVRYFPKLSDVIAGTTTIGEIKPSYARSMKFRLTARDNKAAGGGVCKDETMITTVAATGPFIVTYPTAAGITWTVGDFRTVTWNTAGTALSPILCAKVSIQLSIDGGLTYPVTLISSTNNDGSEEILVPNNVTSQARVRVMAVGNVFYNISGNNFSIVAPSSATFNLGSPTPVYVCSAPSGSVNLNTSSVNSFSVPINFTATSFPSGTSVGFSVNPVTPGSATVVTLFNTNVLANGTYTVTISGTAGAITKTTSLTFIVATAATAPSTLISPANDTTGAVIKPIFNWSAVSGASSYTLEIAKDINFTNLVQSIGSISSIPYSLQNALDENTIYYWRVKTTNTCGEGAPSATPNRFKTGLNSCRIALDVPKDISATGTPTVISDLVIPGAFGANITDLNVVGLNITHSYINDMIVTLTSPSGTIVELFNQICAGQNNISMNLDDQATTTAFPCPPRNNVTVKPANPLSAFNGENSAGTWRLTVYDVSDGDGGSLNGWGLSINTNANTCTFTATPLARTYTFTGNGNWNNTANWSGGSIPPNPLPSGETIVINHIAGGDCLLNVSQTISSGAGITILTGKNLSTQGNLIIQ